MLEGYFVKPSTIDKIRGSWLGSQIESYVEWMEVHGYARPTVLRRAPFCFILPSSRRRDAHLRRRLRLGQNSDKRIKIGGIHVTDGDDLEVVRRRRLDRESRTHARQRNEVGTAGSLGNKDRDLMFVDGEQQQGRRLPFEIGQVRAFEGRIRRKGLGIGKIEAERKAALEPGFDGVAIGRDDLRRRAAGESAEVLIE